MSVYKLMHKDDKYGLISLHDATGDFVSVRIDRREISPFLGNADEEKMRMWWKMRAVPASRKTMMDVIRRAGCITSEEYLAKNLALSLTDCYWICPVDAELSWKDVNLWNIDKEIYSELPYHNATSYDPNATLGGQMDKYWDMNREVPELVKSCQIQQGQQAVNEVFASLVHNRQKSDVPYVQYQMSRNEDGAFVRSEAFTSEQKELVPAYEVLYSMKGRNDRSDYENFIQICAEHGLSEEDIRHFLDYQTMVDFVISNSDRHLFNFGVLRDSDTFQIVAPAPVYDNGNSMFFREQKLYDRISILERDISSLYKREEGMIKNVTDRQVIDINRLPSQDETRKLYVDLGITSERSDLISSNYAVKLDLLRDFQKGLTISAYHEKNRDAMHKDSNRENTGIIRDGDGKINISESLKNMYIPKNMGKVEHREDYCER